MYDEFSPENRSVKVRSTSVRVRVRDVDRFHMGISYLWNNCQRGSNRDTDSA